MAMHHEDDLLIFFGLQLQSFRSLQFYYQPRFHNHNLDHNSIFDNANGNLTLYI